MKLKLLVGSVIALVSGVAGVAYAANSYYPPERIDCQVSDNKLSCASFNRNYLAENTTTADFQDGKSQAFYFHSGAAYFASESHDEASVIYTYRNAQGKNVTLKTVVTSIVPDTTSGHWVTKGDIATCDSGYMSCPITDLPNLSKG